MSNELELGSILSEVRKHEIDQQIIDFLAEYLEEEKNYGYSFKESIRELLAKHIAQGEK